MKRSDVVDYALTLVGTPFKFGQSVPQVGMDCVGVLKSVCENFGVPYTCPEAYRIIPHDIILAIMDSQFETTDLYEAANMVVLQYDEESDLGHVGILGNDSMIHAWDKANKVVRSTWIPFWQEKVLEIFLLPGIE